MIFGLQVLLNCSVQLNQHFFYISFMHEFVFFFYFFILFRNYKQAFTSRPKIPRTPDSAISSRQNSAIEIPPLTRSLSPSRPTSAKSKLAIDYLYVFLVTTGGCKVLLAVVYIFNKTCAIYVFKLICFLESYFIKVIK